MHQICHSHEGGNPVNSTTSGSRIKSGMTAKGFSTEPSRLKAEAETQVLRLETEAELGDRVGGWEFPSAFYLFRSLKSQK